MIKSIIRSAFGPLAAVAAFIGLSLGSVPANAAVINLGFAVDGSGSVQMDGFEDQLNGLAAALDNIPTSGPNQYRIGVVWFNDTAETIVMPTIVTAANIDAIKAQITGALADYVGGLTSIASGINQLVADFGAIGSETGLINVTTDGFSTANDVNADIAARNAAFAAGWDSVSAECIIACNDQTSTATQNLLAIGAPQPSVFVTDINNLPDPLTQAFVLQVTSFDEYASAIDAKVQQVTEIPLPAGLPLFISGLGLIGAAVRRRRATA